MQSGASTNAGFDHQPRTRLVFGVNSVARIGELARELGVGRLLLVTDPGLVAAGHVGHVRGFLESAGLAVTVFDRVRENPTTRCVDDCAAVARAASIDAFVGLGGGSSMDTAKGANFLLTNGGQMQDYWGVGKAAKPMLPLIAVPTTAGTGSECQSAALIAIESSHQKMACVDPKAAARIAILDPLLTVSQPARVTACTGIDAISHAVETAVTTRRNPLSLMYSHEAFTLCVRSLPRVLSTPSDLAARGDMLLGAALAGLAIETSMLGIAHSAANPLTAHFDIVHGQAVGMLLPAVVRFNSAVPAIAEAYAHLASGPEIACASEGHGEAVEALIVRLEEMLDQAGMPGSLAECGLTAADVPQLAEEASRQWTAAFNPRAASIDDFANLYRAALQPRGDRDNLPCLT